MTMHCTLTAALAVAILALFGGAAPASAAINDYVGTWDNVDADTGGMTRVIVRRVTNAVEVQAFGSCTPTDCDWGSVTAEVYGAGASSNPIATVQAIKATFDSGFSVKTVILKRVGSDMEATVLNRFTDNSGRDDYASTERLAKAADPGPGGLIGQIGTIIQNPGVLLAVPEQDCISFNTANPHGANVGGQWMIVDGGMQMLAFGDNQAEAEDALDVIKTYGLSQQCFVGRPGPSFTYWLKGNQGPAGAGAGEDCLAFNKDNIEVKQVSGSWKIVDGNRWMFDFGNKEDEAKTAFNLMKFYGFSKTCYVGRPGPSMTYLLR